LPYLLCLIVCISGTGIKQGCEVVEKESGGYWVLVFMIDHSGLIDGTYWISLKLHRRGVYTS